MMKRWLYSLCITLPGGMLTAQHCDVHLRGQILDRATREPLEYTTVYVQEANRSVLADDEGVFELANLCPGTYHLRVFHLGCPPGNIFLSLRQDTVLTIFLDHHGQLLREVQVEGKYNTMSQSQTRQTLSSAMIRDQSGKSLSEIVSQVAGIRTLRNGSGISKPIIHGLYGNRVAVVNNGLLQAGQQWGVDHAPEIDPNAASIITVVKGSEAIEYGSQALGGALLVEAGPILPDPHLHGVIGYGFQTNGRGHVLSGQIQSSYLKFDWRATATARMSGDTHTPDYFLTNTGNRELNSSVQLIYRPTPSQQHQLYYSLFNTRIGIFAGSHISNLTDLQEAIGRQIPFRINDRFSYAIEEPKQHVVHHLLKYSGKRFLKEEIFLDWTYGLQYNHRQEFDIRRGDRSEIPALDLGLWAHFVKAKYTNQTRAWKYSAGLEAKWTDNTNNYDTGILPLIPDYREGSAGMFSMVQYPSGKWLWESGLRYDFQSLHVWAITPTLPRAIIKRQHEFHDIAFSVGTVYKISTEAETRFHHVFTRRSPEPNELYSSGLHQGVAGIEEGDWNLAPELSLKSMLTQSMAIHKLLHMEIGLYSHLFHQYIYLKPEDELRLTIRGAFPVYTYQQENAWIRGVDLVLVSDFSHHLEGSFKYSWISATSLKGDRALSLIPPPYFNTSMSWAFHDSPTFKGARIMVTGEYTARQKNWDLDSELWPPPKAYFLLLLKFNVGIKIQSHILHAGITIDNLLDVRYRNYLNRLRYFSDEQGRGVQVNIRYEF